MNIQDIGRGDSWSRFMQLKNDAQLRNQGLVGTAQRAAVVRQPSRTAAVPAQTFAPALLRSNVYSGSSTRPVVATRILGGTFDAYA